MFPKEEEYLQVDLRRLHLVALVGTQDGPLTEDEAAALLAERAKVWKPRPVKYESGILRLFGVVSSFI